MGVPKMPCRMKFAAFILALTGTVTCKVAKTGQMWCKGTDGSLFVLVMPSPTPWATPIPFPPPSGGPYCGKGIVMSNGQVCIQ